MSAQSDGEAVARARRRRIALAVALGLACLALLWQRMLWQRMRPGDAPALSLSAAPASSSAQAQRRPLRLTGGPRQPIPLTRGSITDSGAAIGKLEGRVISATDGRPLPGARLSFASGSIFSIESDAEGRFVFQPPRADSYVLVLATKEGFLPFAPEWGHSSLVFQARRGRGLSGADVRLTPAVDYTARVLDPDGEPVEGARVEVLGGPASEASLAPSPATVTTDARGEAVFQAPDHAIVQASAGGYASARGAVNFSVQVNKTLTLRLGALADEPERASIAGRVIDAHGQPTADAVVEARWSPRSPEQRQAEPDVPTVRVAVRDDGTFELSDLLAGRYVLTATAPGFAPAVAREVAAPSRGVELTLSTGSALFGRVTQAADGAPIPSFAVVVRERLGPLARDVLTVESFFDADGRYEIPHLPDGDWEVSVSAFGFVPSDPHDVRIRGGDVERDFALGRGGVVRGVVKDAASGEPIEGAKISIEGTWGGGGGGVQLLASAVSDERGRFELAGVGDDLQSIFVAAAGHHGRIISGIRAGEGQARELVVELTPTEQDEEPRIELAGIGAVLSAEQDVLVIGRVIEGGGAAEAGLVPSDGIVAVNGVAVTILGFAGAINEIRGPEGSTVTLEVRKAGAAATVVLQVVRRRIRS